MPSGVYKRRPNPWPERFWPRVDKNGPEHPYDPALGRCWVWTGGVGVGGYGRMYVKPRNRPTHHLAYELLVGPVPPGLEMCHSCNNPPCCNPDHVAPDTRQKNVLYAFATGQLTRAGVKNSRAKLTEQQVSEIRARRSAGERAVDLATEFQVSKSLVFAIVRGSAWAHLQEPA